MADVDFYNAQRKKCKFILNFSKCVICQQKSEEDLIQFSEKSKIAFFEALEARQDELLQKFLHEFQSIEQIPKDSLNIVYHRSCYKSYTSKHNILSVCTSRDATIIPGEVSSHAPAKCTRSQLKTFGWNVCIVCMKEKYKKKKILHHLETRSRLLSILEAAKLLKDFPMISLLEEENILEKALYHNPCVTMYIAKSKMAQIVTPQNAVENAYEVAFGKLTSEIEVKIFDMKQIADMSSLHQLFLSYLPSDVPRAFSQKRLRRWLEKHYGKRINIEMGRTGQGISSLVISSEVNVCEAVRTKALSAPDDDLHFESSNKETLTDDQILHRAAAILRKDINEMKIDLKTYPDSSEVSIENSLQRIPSNLNQFILWLIDDNCHRKSQTATNGSKMRQSLAISECLVSLSRDTFTPFHLALALHVHHEYGSKNTVELLHSHGFCASYTEVRRFLTSVADCEISRHCSNDTSLSAGLVPVSMGGLLIQEGADNVDINSETIDGKDTFHSMARVIFQERAVSSSLSARRIEPRFSRGIERSQKQDDSADAILRCFSFQKPSTRPEPPKYTDPNDAILACSSEVFPAKDIMWVLLRTINRNILPGLTFSGIPNVQKIPFWTGFNASISKPNDFYNVAVYEPIIDGKPSEMATVYTAMKRCIAMSKRAGQSHSIQTFDQQLYSIAQQVKWAHPDLFDTHILRLGGFHMLSCYIASIGKLWADGGLRDLLVDSGVYAGNTVEHMLNWKEFNRGVRALTLVFETLVTLQYQAFWNWCFQQERLNEISDAVLDQLKQFHLNYQVTHDQESFIRLEEIYRTSIDPMIDEFRTWGCSTSPTFQYWDMLIQAIQVMLSFIRAEREGTWSLHLKAVADMIPYFFVTNRTNYCRWTPVYLLDMISLPDEVRTSFNEGKFAIRQIPGFFNGIWSDMATEKTVIKDMKGVGGIVGMTQNKSALLRWSMTKHTPAAYSRSLQDRTSCGVQSSQVPHQEVSPASMKRDEEHVQQLLMHFEQNMTDPFEVEKHPPCLLNVSSGMLASKEVQESLLTALNQGYAMLVDFLQRSFDSNTSGSFYKPIPKSKLKSFATMSCKARSDTTKGSAGHVNPEILFRRALLLSHVRPDVSLETVLSYPVGPVPISLFHEDGSIRKTNKSELATQLETLVKKKKKP
ncbi:hypothetical protein FSP39_006702 [Pinctada imbricata]|uniref:Uncharacterized protein n=1 Tax=Pinctada imbricata TaxID=66713 RepID=A0AA89C032_PINIB|nr:hypothetical protein FSP39_006702 [Pinctada imbricata]